MFDLPPELSDDSLVQVLGSYGKVERVVREKFPANLGLSHMPTGVRGVHIDVSKEIPPCVDVLNWKGRIVYSGLKDTCFLCQAMDIAGVPAPNVRTEISRTNDRRKPQPRTRNIVGKGKLRKTTGKCSN